MIKFKSVQNCSLSPLQRGKVPPLQEEEARRREPEGDMHHSLVSIFSSGSLGRGTSSSSSRRERGTSFDHGLGGHLLVHWPCNYRPFWNYPTNFTLFQLTSDFTEVKLFVLFKLTIASSFITLLTINQLFLILFTKS